MDISLAFDPTNAGYFSVRNEEKIGEPEPDEVIIRHTAIGVNFVDVLMRQGKLALPAVSKGICGFEACGVIQKIGRNVQKFDIGQRVAYATAPAGAYCTTRAVHSKYIVAVPDDIDDKVVAASLFKGLTAHYLAFRLFIVTDNVSVVVHSAASGVGQILAQWCKNLGALVIGTVGADFKKATAQEYCDHVFNYNTENWQQEVIKITEGKGVNVVYDSVGRSTFGRSLDCLMPIGIMVLYGETSGGIEQVDLDLLSRRSLFLTCPNLFDYKGNRMELIMSAEEVFNNIIAGSLKVNIAKEFPLTEAEQAHKLVESGKTIGSVILIP
ncbi:quinone oxidoreductase [Rickettsiales endosymbiont of Peranema trichophorum]|uniref:quinone oxidoreductase family protein n=1 Tax=Rickettsiales endosymbiont of Peranema trichophorum TaxID=2486577 RepID=UPI0010CF6068|nr:quinone oxidoreductase [Rickettsiales endosymbiont of Peranema trichophorum]RZI47599.1 quinone oxidoreductase [Rickettsiales endosymbiont of Peranema trichophorum]